MSLIACPDCHRQVSQSAPTCPGCGRPIAQAQQPKEAWRTSAINTAGMAYGTTMIAKAVFGVAALIAVAVMYYFMGR